MREGLVQLQLIVPSLSTDATLTASLKRDGNLTLEVESDIKLPEISSLQKVTFIYSKYILTVSLHTGPLQGDFSTYLVLCPDCEMLLFFSGEEDMEVQVKSDVSTEIQKMLPSTEAVQNWLQQFSQDILDQKVVKTDMKLRHIYNKAIEVQKKKKNIFMRHISICLSIFVYQSKLSM